MESQPQNPEFRINPENFYPCIFFSQIMKKVNLNKYGNNWFPFKRYVLGT